MQEIDFYLVDAFSESSFGGNPAAVCPLDAWLPDETLLRMAQQHNQSETAFFVCTKGGINLGERGEPAQLNPPFGADKKRGFRLVMLLRHTQ